MKTLSEDTWDLKWIDDVSYECLLVKRVRQYIKSLKSESICKDCSVGYDVGCDCDDQVFLLNVHDLERLSGPKLNDTVHAVSEGEGK